MYQIIIRHLWRVREYDVVRAYSLSGGVGRQIGFSAGVFHSCYFSQFHAMINDCARIGTHTQRIWICTRARVL